MKDYRFCRLAAAVTALLIGPCFGQVGAEIEAINDDVQLNKPTTGTGSASLNVTAIETVGVRIGPVSGHPNSSGDAKFRLVDKGLWGRS